MGYMIHKLLFSCHKSSKELCANYLQPYLSYGRALTPEWLQYHVMMIKIFSVSKQWIADALC